MVLTDPLHELYGKVNKFLNRGPQWEIAKLPSYWIDKILLNESDYDDSHHNEVSWLLDLFIGGLRSKKVRFFFFFFYNFIIDSPKSNSH